MCFAKLPTAVKLPGEPSRTHHAHMCSHDPPATEEATGGLACCQGKVELQSSRPDNDITKDIQWLSSLILLCWSLTQQMT